MKFDKYTRIARIYPTALSIVPVVILVSHLTSVEFKKILQEILVFQILADISISLILLYLSMQVVRFISKEVFEKWYFKNEIEMPTTNLLLFSDSELSKNYKVRIREQVQKDFEFHINSEEEEANNPNESRKQIVSAVGLIRGKVKNGQLLLQHNIEYGFVRNLIGGSMIGFIFSVIDILYFKYWSIHPTLYKVSIFLLIVFLVILLLSKFLINRYGYLYAKRLFQEYLTL